MGAGGSRSVTQSGPSLTAESSVACSASPGRRSTMPESTSEYVWSWVGHRTKLGDGLYSVMSTYVEMYSVIQ